MPVMTMLAIAGAAWVLLFVVVWVMCTAAARSDRRVDVLGAEAELAPPLPVPAPPVVADTGGIRAHLRAAAKLVDAEQLTVSLDLDGTDAVIASSRSVVAAMDGEWPQVTLPVALGGRTVATLRAVRRPGAPAFDRADRLVLQGLAARISGSMEAAHAPADVPVSRPTALA